MLVDDIAVLAHVMWDLKLLSSLSLVRVYKRVYIFVATSENKLLVPLFLSGFVLYGIEVTHLKLYQYMSW